MDDVCNAQLNQQSYLRDMIRRWAAATIVILWSVSPGAGSLSPTAAVAASPPAAIGLDIQIDGVYRVTFDYLDSLGYDPAGMVVAGLGLSDDGTPVPIFISHNNSSVVNLQAGDYIEFYAHPLSNTYSATNVYVLTDDGSALSCPTLPGGVCEIKPASAPAPKNPSSVATDSYLDDQRSMLDPAISGQTAYTVGDSWPSTGDQNWVEGDVVTCSPASSCPPPAGQTSSGTNTSMLLNFSLPSPAGSGTCYVTVPLAAVIDQPTNRSASQMVSLAINGNFATNLNGGGQIFSWDDGQTTGFYTAQGSFPCSALNAAGSSGLSRDTLTVSATLPPGITLNEDMPQSFTVSYPESLCSTGDQLHWIGNGRLSYTVGGFATPAVHLWRVAGSQERLYVKGSSLSANGCGSGSTYGFSFGDTAVGKANYYATADPLTPASSAALSLGAITSGGPNSAQYLVITSPEFVGDQHLATLAGDHGGLTYKIVDTQSIYDQYQSSTGAFAATTGATAPPGDGQVNPEAIRAYVAFAHANLGTEYVLLAGGDTDDYHNYLGCPASGRCKATNPDNVSVVPTLYQNSVFDGPTPSDNLFAVPPGQSTTAPDVAVGRLPAITPSQLDLEIQKSVDWLNGGAQTYKDTASFVAGFPFSSNYGCGSYADSTFVNASNIMAGQLLGLSAFDGHVHELYEDGTQADDLSNRAKLLSDLKAGTEIVNFVGHGNTQQWSCLPDLQSYSTTAGAYAGGLTNSNRPAAVFQWGCQATNIQNPQLPNVDSTLLADEDSSGNPTGATIAVGSSGDDLDIPQEVLAGGTTLGTGRAGVNYFYGYLINGDTVGQALEFAKDDLITTWGSNQNFVDVVNSYTILGDPALTIPT